MESDNTLSDVGARLKALLNHYFDSALSWQSAAGRPTHAETRDLLVKRLLHDMGQIGALVPASELATTTPVAGVEDRDPFDDKERAAANRIGLPPIVSQPGRDEGLEEAKIKSIAIAQANAIIGSQIDPDGRTADSVLDDDQNALLHCYIVEGIEAAIRALRSKPSEQVKEK